MGAVADQNDADARRVEADIEPVDDRDDKLDKCLELVCGRRRVYDENEVDVRLTVADR